MRLIHKTEIVLSSTEYKYLLPLDSTIIHVEYQKGVGACIYYIFDVSNQEKLVDRTLAIFGTGHAIPDYYKHIGSFLMDVFVWHLFEDERSI